MRAWRICRKPYAPSTLDGVGGLYTSGRWHSRGHPVIYTASSAALAALEVLVHVDPLTAPTDLCLLAIEIPDDLSTEILDSATLPAGWNAVPAPAALQTLGTAWLVSARSAVLIVPSAFITVEQNLLLNPRHPELRRVRVVGEDPFSFEPRLP